MKKNNNIIYVRENISKIELWENKKIIKKYSKLINTKTKKNIKKILNIMINLNFYKRFFLQNIKFKKVDNNIFAIIPTLNVKNKIIKKIVEKRLKKSICKFVSKNEISYITISNKLKSNKVLLDISKEFKIKNLNGKIALKYQALEVVRYIAEKRNEQLESQKIYILVRENTNINVELIKYMSSKIKCLYVVTFELRRFKNLERKLYEENGIMIVLVNNRRRTLRNADIIINMDFDEKDILEYTINRNSIIINVKNTDLDLNNTFDGIIINSIKTNYINNDLRYSLFDKDEILESLILEKEESNDTYKIIKFIEDNTHIDYLIGKRGKIEEAEYIKVKNSLTNP